MIGNKILELRKKKGLSQEQLAEKINVTRQTISNWETSQTTPDIEQTILLSQKLEISLDELVGNNTNNIIIGKISNTEKLAGIIIVILKIFGFLIVGALILNIIALLLFLPAKKTVSSSYVEEIDLSCTLIEDYLISIGNDGYFNCSNCTKELTEELKNKYVDYSDLLKTEKSITNYFVSKNGTCNN